MARTIRRNKGDSSEMILLLAAAGAAVYGYFAGWFSSFGFGPAAAAPATPAATPPPTPPLGTVLTATWQLAAQVAAGDKYILPGALLSTTPPTGYTIAIDAYKSETGNATGAFYLRNDVAAAAVSYVNVLLAQQSLPPVTLGTLYTFPLSSLALVNQIATGAGLSGLGGLAQYMYTRTGRG